MFRLTIAVATLLGLSSVSHAQFGTGDNAASTATLVSENTAIAPGKTFSVAMQLSHPEEWHSYYKNSGGVEEHPSIEWKLPEGFSAGPIQWPFPEVKDGLFGKSFVYSGEPAFLVDITVPAALEIGTTVTFAANAKWQICKDSCINENAAFTLKLEVAANAVKDPAKAALFEKARKNQPKTIPSLAISAVPSAKEIELRISPAASIEGTPTDFVPDVPFLQPVSAGGSIKRDGDTWVVTMQRKMLDPLERPIEQGKSISGILIGPLPVTIGTTSLSAAAPAKSLPFSEYSNILLGMLVGGLILNLMPCVFPVIGLKIMGFVQQAGSARGKIALHGLMFTAGVLASFGVLSGILFAARASVGNSIGWGYQLQNPWVVLALMLLMFLLALNMFGLFELGTSATSVGGSLQSKQGLAGSFFSGILATVVATPCSAPFLGVAIGAAIGLPAFQFFAAFAAMAIGLSLPYLILSIFPKLIGFLPRPGAWMESFKQAMSFFLFATAGYLLWVYAGQIGLENLLGPIFGLSAIAVAAWIYGRWNLPHRPSATRVTSTMIAVLIAAAGFYLIKPPEKSALVWEPWSQERVDELVAAGTPVYIDFTAQWCATCQFNKKRAYTKDVIALMKQRGVVALKADKTNPDAKIEEKLQELKRTAIPVNVLVVPGKDPIVTQELLSPQYMKDLLEKNIPVKASGT